MLAITYIKEYFNYQFPNSEIIITPFQGDMIKKDGCFYTGTFYSKKDDVLITLADDSLIEMHGVGMLENLIIKDFDLDNESEKIICCGYQIQLKTGFLIKKEIVIVDRPDLS